MYGYLTVDVGRMCLVSQLIVLVWLVVFVSSLYQFMGVRLFVVRYSLVLEKCLLPKNPRYDDSGDGCGAVNTRWRVRSINAPFFMAYEPHRINTTPVRCSDNALITASVNCSHP